MRKTTRPDFEKWAHVIQHGPQGFIVKNIEGESTKANDLSHILLKWSVAHIIPNVANVFTKLKLNPSGGI